MFYPSALSCTLDNGSYCDLGLWKMCRIVLVAKHANGNSDLCQCKYSKRQETYAKRQCLVFWYRCRCTQDAEEQARFLQASRYGKTNKPKCHANFSSIIKLMVIVRETCFTD